MLPNATSSSIYAASYETLTSVKEKMYAFVKLYYSTGLYTNIYDYGRNTTDIADLGNLKISDIDFVESL